MIDLNQRDFFVSVPNDLREAAPIGFWEGVAATAAYNNMPMVESVQETKNFYFRDRDASFDPIESISDEYLPYYEELLRAKDSEHFAFIKQRIDNEMLRKRKMAGASFSAQIVGGIADPLFVTAFVPALNAVSFGTTIAKSAYNFGKVGAAYGLASEARRAPFAQTDAPFESETNVISATVFSGFFGGALKGASFTKPFFQSSANKINRMARGEDVPPLFADENAGSPTIVGDEQKFDAKVDNPFGSYFQRMLSNPRVPAVVKKMALKYNFNSSINLKGGADTTAPQSVSQMAQTYEGYAHEYMKKFQDLHRMQVDGHRQARFLGTNTNELTFSTGEFNDWFEDTVTRYMRQDNPNPTVRRKALDGATKEQKQAFKEFDTFFKQFDEDARFVGVLRDDARIKKQMEKLQKLVDEKAQKLANLEDSMKAKGGATPKQAKKQKEFDGEMAGLRTKLDELQNVLDTPTRKSFRFAMYYNKALLDGDDAAREKFTQTLIDHYTNKGLPNPEKSAKATVARILEEAAEELEDARASGVAGSTKHLRHRKTDLEEWQVEEFLVKTPDVFHTYAQQMGRRIEHARAFDGKNIDEILEEVTDALVKARMSDKEIADIRTAFVGEHDRVMGALSRSPDRYDNQLSKFLKTYAGWVYLGGAGISAVTDAGTIVLAHGYRDVYRAAVAGITDRSTGKLLSEMQNGGAALDMIRNFAQQKILGDTMKRVQPNKLEQAQEIGNRFMYTANGLGPLTTIFKFADGILTNDKFYRLSKKLKSGRINIRDREYLNRYGIDDELASYIQDMPFQKAEGSNFMLANTDNWPVNTPQERLMKRRYQAAVTAHSDNSVVMGQAFDRPLIMDGVTYVKDNPAFAGMRKMYPNLFAIDKRASYGGVNMVRLESGMMTIPFTFMNFVFGANNKILGAMLDPARQNRIQGATALIALSYLSFEIKSGLGMAKWWDREDESPDVIARVIDHSGLMGIYGDLGYMGLSIAGNMADKPEDFFIEPKFVSSNKDERFVDGLVTPFGAPADLGVGFYRAARDLVDGNMSDGAQELRRALPFVGLPLIRDDVKELTNTISRY